MSNHKLNLSECLSPAKTYFSIELFEGGEIVLFRRDEMPDGAINRSAWDIENLDHLKSKLDELIFQTEKSPDC